MRLIHISDAHVGFRAYNRVTPYGVNQREEDVFLAFRDAMARLPELEADLILLAGDLFHSVRPSNRIIERTFRLFLQLRAKTSVPIVMIAGNHESPRSADTGCILKLFTCIPDVHVRDGRPDCVYLPSLDLQVFCMPHRGLVDLETTQILPEPGSKYKVLVLHGTIEGMPTNPYDTVTISRRHLNASAWDYMAFGHYHSCQQVEARGWYSGSLEQTDPNFWKSLKEPKGFIEYDLDEHKMVEFHKVKGNREFRDLGRIDAAGLGPKDLDARLAAELAKVRGGLADKVARLWFENVPPAVKRELDMRAIRDACASALNLDIRFYPPGQARRDEEDGADRPRRTLEAEWDDFVAAQTVPAGVERERVRQEGRSYLAGVQEANL